MGRPWWGALLVAVAVVGVAAPRLSTAQGALGSALQEARPVAALAAPVRWTVEGPRGASGVANIVAQLDSGWRLYATTQPAGGPVPTQFTVLAPWRATGNVEAPPPQAYRDLTFAMTTAVYADSVRFTVPVTRAADDTGALRLTVTYQGCTARVCIPPRTDTIGVGIDAVRAAPGPAASATRIDSISGASQASAAPAVQGRTTMGLGALLGTAVSTALLALLTPCVFPMIPITVGYFGSRTGQSRRVARRDVLTFAAGIVAAFVALGGGVSLLLGATGVQRLASDPWLNLVIAALFLLFALQLLGRVQVALPSALLTRLTRASQDGDGVGPVLLMGGTFALTSFTCTAPFVGSLLVLAATGSVSQPLVGLVAFATVFAAPFVVLALAPRAVARLPRSGPWLDTVKGVAAFAEVAAVVKFVANAGMVWGWRWMTREAVIVAWIGVLMALAVWLWRRPRRATTGVPAHAWPRLAATATVAAAALWLARGARGRGLGELEAYLPPHAVSGALAFDGARELPWRLNDWQASLAEARATGRPLLVDFTGYTCTNCRWMEANMFPRPAVRAALARFERARLYTDGRGEPYTAQQALQAARFGTVALPLYVILRPDGTTAVAHFLGMTRDEGEFLAFLAAGVGAGS